MLSTTMIFGWIMQVSILISLFFVLGIERALGGWTSTHPTISRSPYNLPVPSYPPHIYIDFPLTDIFSFSFVICTFPLFLHPELTFVTDSYRIYSRY